MESRLKEKREEFKAKEKELATIFEEAGDEVDLSQSEALKSYFEGDSDKAKADKDAAAEIKRRNKELDDLGIEIDRLRLAEQVTESREDRKSFLDQVDRSKLGDSLSSQVTKDMQSLMDGKTLGDMFLESPSYKNIEGKYGPEGSWEVDLKALFRTAAGYDPQDIRTGDQIPLPTKPLGILDLVVTVPTNQSAIVYMRQSTRTNAAAEVNEASDLSAAGQLYPEATIAWTETTAPVKKIAVFLPVTEEQMEDEPGIAGLINNDLEYMLRERLDGQILNGDGSGANLTGILNTSGIGTTAAANNNVIADEVLKAITSVEAGNSSGTMNGIVDASLLNPNDWMKVRLMKTSQNAYIWGHPAEPGVRRLWGRTVITTPMLTAETGLVGDFGNFFRLRDRRDVRIQYGEQHSDYFRRGVVAVRADVRVAIQIMRPAAFHSITNLGGT